MPHQPAGWRRSQLPFTTCMVLTEASVVLQPPSRKQAVVGLAMPELAVRAVWVVQVGLALRKKVRNGGCKSEGANRPTERPSGSIGTETKY